MRAHGFRVAADAKEVPANRTTQRAPVGNDPQRLRDVSSRRAAGNAGFPPPRRLDASVRIDRNYLYGNKQNRLTDRYFVAMVPFCPENEL